MKRTTTMLLAGLLLGACGDTDAPEVEPVQMDTLRWFSEGRTVEFQGRTWIVVGAPMFDPMVEYVGEFEGTPLYAEIGATTPSALYIPVGGDRWQRLEPAPPPPAGEERDGAGPESG